MISALLKNIISFLGHLELRNYEDEIVCTLHIHEVDAVLDDLDLLSPRGSIPVHWEKGNLGFVKALARTHHLNPGLLTGKEQILD